MFRKGGQAEILRAHQRDDLFQNQLQTSFSELSLDTLGVQKWIKYREIIKKLSNTLYQSVTTLSNIQTLGEEYTGIVQVGSSLRDLPPKQAQILMILMNVFGENILVHLLMQFENYLKSLPGNHPLREEARIQLENTSNIIRKSLPLILSLHKAVFYLNGNYYHLSKRLTNVQYILIRHWLKDKTSLSGFRTLGAISLLNITVHILYNIYSWKKEIDQTTAVQATFDKINEDEYVRDKDKCSLCLNKRQSTSVTPCGHLFCWTCIIPWLQENPQCPLCRVQANPSRVVLLQNYYDVVN